MFNRIWVFWIRVKVGSPAKSNENDNVANSHLNKIVLDVSKSKRFRFRSRQDLRISERM